MSRSAARRRPGRPPRAEMTPEDIMRAAALKKFRGEAGLSQRALAELMGVSHETLGDWERGRRRIPPDRFAWLVTEAGRRAAEQAGENPLAATDGAPEVPPQAAEGAPPPPPEPGGWFTDAPPRPSSEAPPTPSFEEILDDMRDGAARGQQRMAQDFTVMVQAVAMVVASVHQPIGGIWYNLAPSLGVKAAAVAEISPLMKRFLELLSFGAWADFTATLVLGGVVPTLQQLGLLPMPKLSPEQEAAARLWAEQQMAAAQAANGAAGEQASSSYPPVP